MKLIITISVIRFVTLSYRQIFFEKKNDFLIWNCCFIVVSKLSRFVQIHSFVLKIDEVSKKETSRLEYHFADQSRSDRLMATVSRFMVDQVGYPWKSDQNYRPPDRCKEVGKHPLIRAEKYAAEFERLSNDVKTVLLGIWFITATPKIIFKIRILKIPEMVNRDAKKVFEISKCNLFLPCITNKSKSNQKNIPDSLNSTVFP